MRVHIQKWGNSLAVRIPRSLAIESRIEQGAEAELSLIEGKLVITPIQHSDYPLEKLVADITDQNRHHETDTGPIRGHEIW
jgi:antitoxin MazE